MEGMDKEQREAVSEKGGAVYVSDFEDGGGGYEPRSAALQAGKGKISILP